MAAAKTALACLKKHEILDVLVIITTWRINNVDEQFKFLI
jgi:hypothetical protein